MSLPRDLPDDIGNAIGTWSPVAHGPLAVERGFLHHWCEVFQDANPAYTDEAYASRSRHRTLIAPPTAVFSLTSPYAWLPPHVQPAATSPGAFSNPYGLLRRRYALTGAIGLAMHLQWRAAIKLGDRLRGRSRVVAIDGPVESSVGEGYRVSHEREFLSGEGSPLAFAQLQTFVYRCVREKRTLLEGHLPGIYENFSAYALPGGLEHETPVPTLEFPNPVLMHYRAASALRDWNVYHVDSDYVRARAGLGSMYASILFIMALLSRFATDWSGPEWELRSLRGRIGALIHPGDTVRIEGVITDRRRDQGQETVTLDAVVRTQRATVMPVQLGLMRPQDSPPATP